MYCECVYACKCACEDVRMCACDSDSLHVQNIPEVFPLCLLLTNQDECTSKCPEGQHWRSGDQFACRR